MIEPLLEKTLVCVSQAMNDAKLEPKDIDKVMLVGGATRTPRVHEVLASKLNIEPRFEINPDLIVAMGAAVQGGIIAGEKRETVLVDITPHSFSTACLDGGSPFGGLKCVKVIHRNTPLPVSKCEAFETPYDFQKRVEVEIYQGESVVPEENLLLGKFLIRKD